VIGYDRMHICHVCAISVVDGVEQWITTHKFEATQEKLTLFHLLFFVLIIMTSRGTK
jgi:hypothetical protein